MLITVALITACLVLLMSFGGSFFGRTLSIIVYPYHATRHWFMESTALLPSYMRSRNELLAEIATYKNNLAQQAANDALINKLQTDNEELRALLNAHDPERIAASVVARPPYLPYDSYLIDRGESSGITSGAHVYYHNDYALGYVAKTFPHSALVTLYSAPSVHFSAYIIGPNIFADAYGEGGGVIRVSVPQGITLAVGNVVVAPGLDGGLIGSINSIISEPTEPEQYGFVVLPIPLQSIRTVAVSQTTLESIDFSTAVDAITSFITPQLTFDIPTSTIDFLTPTSSTPTNGSPHATTTNL